MKIQFNKDQKWSFGTGSIFEYKEGQILDLEDKRANLIVSNGYGLIIKDKKIENYENKKFDNIDNKIKTSVFAIQEDEQKKVKKKSKKEVEI
jgi:hypothetical protein